MKLPQPLSLSLSLSLFILRAKSHEMNQRIEDLGAQTSVEELRGSNYTVMYESCLKAVWELNWLIGLRHLTSESPLKLDMNYYQILFNSINRLHPDLVQEVITEDLPEGKEKLYHLGTFLEIKEPDRSEGGYNQYYIYIRTDHPQAEDTEKKLATLAHEYGHYVCRTFLYPHLPLLGKVALQELGNRKPYRTKRTFPLTLVILLEELIAWLFAWCLLYSIHALKKQHISFGFECWKTYWNYFKPWVKRKNKQNKSIVPIL